ncbi:hypothetical protein REPUB_Repub01dG0184100 [Reevesia pubescens]
MKPMGTKIEEETQISEMSLDPVNTNPQTLVIRNCFKIDRKIHNNVPRNPYMQMVLGHLCDVSSNSPCDCELASDLSSSWIFSIPEVVVVETRRDRRSFLGTSKTTLAAIR